MRLTRKIIRDIKAACREACRGRRRVEIGERDWNGKPADVDGMNFILWGDDADLQEVWKIDGLVGSEIVSAGGWVALDCYCYNIAHFGREPDDALDCNVYILLSPPEPIGVCCVCK